MKKILLATIALTLFATPVMADNDDAAYLLGGIAGGLLLGEIVNNNHHHRRYYVEEEQYYVPPPVEECVTKYVRYYDSMGNWVRRPVRRCYWVNE